MSKDQKFGVPIAKSPQMIMPLSAHRFRVVDCHQVVTENVDNVWIDFIKKQVHLKVRTTILPESFNESAVLNDFSVEVMDGSCDPLYGFRFEGLKKIVHEFRLSYATPGYAYHEYVFDFYHISVMLPVKVEPTPSANDPAFPSIAEAMEEYEAKAVTPKVKSAKKLK